MEMTQEQIDAELSSFEKSANKGKGKIVLPFSMKTDEMKLPNIQMSVDTTSGLKPETPVSNTTYIIKKSGTQLW